MMNKLQYPHFNAYLLCNGNIKTKKILTVQLFELLAVCAAFLFAKIICGNSEAYEGQSDGVTLQKNIQSKMGKMCLEHQISAVSFFCLFCFARCFTIQSVLWCSYQISFNLFKGSIQNHCCKLYCMRVEGPQLCRRIDFHLKRAKRG